MPSVVEQMRITPKPGDLANWWGQSNKLAMTGPLDDEEQAYMDVFTSSQVDPILRIGRGILKASALTAEDKETAKRLFGDNAAAAQMFTNYENRRRIVAHYVTTHPATVRYEMGLYRLSRDLIPPVFFAERIYELFAGKEAFTGETASRLQAGADILIAVVVIGALSKARAMTAPPPSGKPLVLTDPIYDLPKEGGGMRINGRYYTEHALERMAPDTPQIRAELRARAAARLRKLGIIEGSPAWDACLGRALQKIDPRGVPPSVVEAEITAPGSTSVRVITAKGGQVVITIIPK